MYSYTQPKQVTLDTDAIPDVPSVSTEAAVRTKTLLELIPLMIAVVIIVAAVVIPATVIIATTAPKLPVGSIILYSASLSTISTPTYKWLICDGSAVSRSTYSDLFNVIGVTYGSGNGVDTFNVPDFRSRFPLGSNGSSSSLVSGGASSHTIITAELPAHTHNEGTLVTLNAGSHTHIPNDPGHRHGGVTGSGPFGTGSLTMTGSGGGSDSGTHTHTISNDFTGITLPTAPDHTHTIQGSTGSVGSSQSFSMMPPYQTIHYIIRA